MPVLLMHVTFVSLKHGGQAELQISSNLQTRFGDICLGIGDIFGPKEC